MKTKVQACGGALQKKRKAENYTEITGARSQMKTKKDVNIGEITRSFLDKKDKSDPQKDKRINILIKELYRIALSDKGYSKIRAIEILFDRGYGKPIEHVSITGGGAMTGVTINVEGVLPDTSLPVAEITEIKGETVKKIEYEKEC